MIFFYWSLFGDTLFIPTPTRNAHPNRHSHRHQDKHSQRRHRQHEDKHGEGLPRRVLLALLLHHRPALRHVVGHLAQTFLCKRTIFSEHDVGRSAYGLQIGVSKICCCHSKGLLVHRMAGGESHLFNFTKFRQKISVESGKLLNIYSKELTWCTSCSVTHSLSYWVEQIWKSPKSDFEVLAQVKSWSWREKLDFSCCRKDGWSLSSWSPLLLVGRSPWQAESCTRSRWRSGRFGRTLWNSSWCSCPGSLLPVVIYVKFYVSGTGDAKRFYFNLIQHNCESKSSFKRLKFESCFLSRPVQPHI